MISTLDLCTYTIYVRFAYVTYTLRIHMVTCFYHLALLVCQTSTSTSTNLDKSYLIDHLLLPYAWWLCQSVRNLLPAATIYTIRICIAIWFYHLHVGYVSLSGIYSLQLPSTQFSSTTIIFISTITLCHGLFWRSAELTSVRIRLLGASGHVVLCWRCSSMADVTNREKREWISVLHLRCRESCSIVLKMVFHGWCYEQTDIRII